ncbi:putative RING-H2 finger protein ATL21A [Impatiens glandulifera]|uniref:putative RING-H2 finger protein ATL21A n=1 Tax=Impatiens glandulifera TaxID=253017 RepID=UPI001FB0F267|nr:putative RING-H2 finger protein ATL21A [Impatiens glandulifera]
MPCSSIIIIFLFHVSISLIISDAYTDFISSCPAVKCSLDGPTIQFPFYSQGLQNQNCGLPGFRLSCNQKNRTVIQFTEYNSDELEVKSISYDEKKLILIDPRNCVPQVFLNLDHLITSTPFKYYYVTYNFTYLNCSEKVSSFQEEVPCLSGSDHHVYMITESSVVPSSCRILKTVASPFSYSHYLSDNSFGLRLTWDLQDDIVSAYQHEIVVTKGKNLGVVILMAAALALICLKYYSRSKRDLIVEEWMKMVKMECQATDHINKIKEPAVKITMHHNSHTEIPILSRIF